MSKQHKVGVLDPSTALKPLGAMTPPIEVVTEIKEAGQRAIAEARVVGKRTFGEVQEAFSAAKDSGKRTMTEAQEMSLRTRKALKNWWIGLPNDGVRAGIVSGAALAIGLIPTLIIIYRRRGAP